VCIEYIFKNGQNGQNGQGKNKRKNFLEEKKAIHKKIPCFFPCPFCPFCPFFNYV